MLPSSSVASTGTFCAMRSSSTMSLSPSATASKKFWRSAVSSTFSFGRGVSTIARPVLLRRAEPSPLARSRRILSRRTLFLRLVGGPSEPTDSPE